jgi:NAD(P)-dependent dehydrogenase (short-subunit alcohol dehydrogenase family)
MKKVLVTGGAGYIGAHCCVALIEAGMRPIIFDNLCNSYPAVLDRIEKITAMRPELIRGDVRDAAALDALFGAHDISSVIHLAALKAVDAQGGSTDGRAVVARMKATPTEDPLFGRGSIRADGRRLSPVYVFQVKAANNDGVWNEAGTAIRVTITPPFWAASALRVTRIRTRPPARK